MGTNFKYAIAFILSFCLVGCGSGGSTSIDVSDSRFSLTATVSGLDAGKQLQLSNSSEFLTATGNGSIQFQNDLTTGSQYLITIASQPVGQTCTVTNGSGAVSNNNITDISVSCVTNPVATYTVAFTVTGLGAGKSLSLNDGSNTKTVTSNTNYIFGSTYLSGDSYSVNITAQPTGQTCSLSNGSGTFSTNNITNLVVACADNPVATYTVGLTIFGLGVGKQVGLQNGGDSIAGTSNTSYTFATASVTGASYSVNVTSQPVGQTCTVSSGSGAITNNNITNVVINCSDNAAPTYTIGFSVSGLAVGKTLILTDGIENKSITTNGNYTFSNQLSTNSNYAVTIATQPNLQYCKVTDGTGTVNNTSVSNIGVNCSTVYSFSGTNFIYTSNVTGIVSGGAARTYNTWIRLPSALTTYSTIIGQGTLNSYRRSALLIDIASRTPSYNNGAGTYLMQLDFQVGGVWSERFNINDTNWHMISVTFDGTAAGTGTIFYVDGVPLSNSTANPVNGFTKSSVNTQNFNNSITLGGETYDGTTLSPQTGFVGEIRNPNAWSRALTASEISNLYNSVALPTNGLFFTKD
jgi:hypothetical protein